MTILGAQTPEGQPSEETIGPLVGIQRVVVEFVRGLFAQCPLGAYHWEASSGTSQDQEGSDIWIGTENPVDPEMVANRPAITIGRGPAAFHGVGLGDQAYIDVKTGAHVKMDMIPTTVNINILSRNKFEAESLAWFVAENIWNLRNELMRGNTFILYMGQRPSLSPPTPAGALISGPDSEENWIAVTINMPVYLQHMTVAVPLNKPVLREVATVVTASGPRQKLRPRRALVGTTVLSEEPVKVPSRPVSPVLSKEAPATLPQNGLSEAQSSEPLTVRFKT
jgi:hypothetical protein